MTVRDGNGSLVRAVAASAAWLDMRAPFGSHWSAGDQIALKTSAHSSSISG